MNESRILAIGGALIVVLGGCGKSEPPPAPKADAPQEMIVKIGHAAPLTGGIAHLGKDNENGARLAIDELNAEGVVIGGKTRDSTDVLRLGLPVFADGYSCQDVRKRATVDAMNRRIRIKGVEIHPDDLVFCDREGVVVIPRVIERSVIDAAYHNASNEKRIIIDISTGISVDALTSNYGFF